MRIGLLSCLVAAFAQAQLELRAADGSCSLSSPCSNGACCSTAGYCGYGPEYCGDGTTPNSKCISNCGAHSECGQFAKTANQSCPLNVCCSKFGFCGTTSDFCGDGCQSNCNPPISGRSGGDVQKRIIGYYESWNIGKRCAGMDPNQIPVEGLTHLNYAFAYVHPDSFDIGPMPGVDAKTLSQITDLKRKNGALIVGVSLGGWSFNDNGTDTQKVFSNIVSSPQGRDKFISKVMSFMDHYGFDAVDLDWEYPGAPDRGGTDNDSLGYLLLVQAIRKAFDKSARKLYISFTAPSSYWYLRWFDIGKMVDAVDYVNFMTYDLHGTWDNSSAAGPLMLAHTNLTEIDQALQLLWRNKVDPTKVNLGLGFYARTFTMENENCRTPGCPFKAGGNKGPCTDTSGILSYREITDVLASHNKINATWDKTAAVKYFDWDRNQWAAYDDEQTFRQKIDYSNQHGLGGLLIWAIDQDTANYDALRAVIYPKNLTTQNPSSDVDFWNSKQIDHCSATPCGKKCGPGTIEMTTIPCIQDGSIEESTASLCCPLQSAPDPKTCAWRGSPPWCNGQCEGGEVALIGNRWAGNGYCEDGNQFFCCPIPEVADGKGINCGWQDTCNDDQELLTFAGTVLQNWSPGDDYQNLRGADLEKVIGSHKVRRYCCGKKEINNWKDCNWQGTTGKQFDSCDDDHCKVDGTEVELTNSPYGFGKNCLPKAERQRVFCCTPTSGKPLFLPVPLEDLFPNPPGGNTGEPIFNLVTDDTWGTGNVEGKDDPNDASFGFVVITAPEEVHVSLRRRSPWEVYDCVDTDSEHPQTVKMLCAGNETDCNNIHKGYGAVGTIIEMPDGCGPGRYAVVSEMIVAKEQTIPDHLRKRGFHDKRVYDLTFDYDFTKVPRAFGDTQMRVDFSNEEGYWDSVVNRPGESKKKRSEMQDFRRNRKRWLDSEWDDAKTALSHEELHKRWFGKSVIAWLANLVGINKVEANKNVHHTVDETLQVILMDQQFGPCPVGQASAQGNLKATLNSRVKVDTNFGLTIIATLDGDGIRLSDSYLYFKNKGEVTVAFKLDAVASLTYTSGDVKIIGLDNFPGATFRVPGIVTIGPNMEIYGRVDASLVLAGHIEAKATIASWDVQQTYPQNDQYPAQALDKPDQDGTGKTGDPHFTASVSVNGEVQLHLKPKVTFGIVFDKRWGVPDTSASLNMDGYIIFYAEASLSTNSDNSCPFSYGIDGGADLFAQIDAPQIYNWGGSQQIPLGGLRRVPIVPKQCPGGTLSRRELDYSDNNTYSIVPRDTFSIGPIITLPDSFLNCPTAKGNLTNCPTCDEDSLATRADGGSCEYIPPDDDLDDACTTGSTSKRAPSTKYVNMPWGRVSLGTYPACSAADLGAGSVAGWYMPNYLTDTVPKPCDPTIIKASLQGTTVRGKTVRDFNNDHVFEAHMLADFVYWLCGQTPPKNRNVYGAGPIPWLDKIDPAWKRPDAAWVQAVFGTDRSGQDIAGKSQAGYQFVGATNRPSTNWLASVGDYAFGNNNNQNLMKILIAPINNYKKSWTSRAVQAPTGTSGGDYKSIVSRIQRTAAVFSYLNDDDVEYAWINTGLRIEEICVNFDRTWWSDTQARQRIEVGLNNPFQRPSTAPNGATNWGLRTVFNYWLEQHLGRIDGDIQKWIDAHTQALQTQLANGLTGAQATQAQTILQQYLAPNGLAGRFKMHFPRDDTAPLLAAGQSTKSTTAKYHMWDGQRYGANGI